ncbi:MAG: hypothetical protein HYX39_03260 [Bacteroidetes bacterium]|nr:hypothetical protein [Bacteroidota bacterium]
MVLEFYLNKPPEIIFQYLTNMDKFVSVHPIIYKMEHKGDNNYLLFEKLNIFFLPYSFTYIANVVAIGDSSVKIKARVKKMVLIEIDFLLERVNNKTKVTENVSFNSIFPVKKIMGKIFKVQHQKLFENIDRD